MVKLNLRQNALHTLYHAVEHLYLSAQEDDGWLRGASFDHDTHDVTWTSKEGHLCFGGPVHGFTSPPAVYNLKFALLHLIHGSELLLKAYIEQIDPKALFRADTKYTVSLKEALTFVVGHNPKLLLPQEVALLLQAKDLRNTVEHYKFSFGDDHLRARCIDFLGLCVYISQSLLSINLVEAFSWDCLRGGPDSVGDCLASVLRQAPEIGRRSARRAGELWAAQNPSHDVFLCLNCGARSVSVESGTCMGCGVEGDQDVVTLIEEFDSVVKMIRDLEALGIKGSAT